MNNLPCTPRLKGLRLAGRYLRRREQNERYWEKKAREQAAAENTPAHRRPSIS
jgi:hypothetical protein